MRRGFTLIELLVVVAIIAVLVGLLLPGMGKSRATSQQIVCLSNMRQIAMATTLYAQDNKSQVWTAWNWARQPDYNGREPGLLYDYVEKADKIGECPTNKRRGRNGREANDNDGENLFGGFTWLDFDYCMSTYTQGARLDLDVTVGYIPPNATGRRNLDPAMAEQLTLLRTLPIFVEESVWWYNDSIQDGLWGNEDQVTPRHFRGGHWTYLDGSVELFKPPMDDDEVRRNGQTDFEANDIYVNVTKNSTQWFKIYSARGYPYGWVNHPK